jgi:hypothetical protein
LRAADSEMLLDRVARTGEPRERRASPITIASMPSSDERYPVTTFDYTQSARNSMDSRATTIDAYSLQLVEQAVMPDPRALDMRQ